MPSYLSIRYLRCEHCGEVAERRTNNQKYCDRHRHRKSRRHRRTHLACELCEEVVPRGSNNQKYCDACRQLATSNTVAAYYKRHRRRILKQKAKYRAANHERLVEAQRQYHAETKAERLTKNELQVG